MYAQLKNNVCIGISNLPMDESLLPEEESQVEIDDMSFMEIMGKSYVDGKFVDAQQTEEEIEIESNISNQQFLISTDWKVTRHREQLDAGISTSLSDEEYKALLAERQRVRDSIVALD